MNATDNMTNSPLARFSVALDGLLSGEKWRRAGWNGNGQFVRLFRAYSDAQFKVSEIEPTDGTLMDHLVLKNTSNQLIPWVPSQGDLMAEDWEPC